MTLYSVMAAVLSATRISQVSPMRMCSTMSVSRGSARNGCGQSASQQAYGGTNANIGYGGHDEDQGQMGAVSALMKICLFSLRGSSSKQPICEITSPEFDEVTIQLDPKYYPGKRFKIIAHDNTPENVYIQKAALNGKRLDDCWFYHEDFARGGLLDLWLGPQPNQQWGTASFLGSRNE